MTQEVSFPDAETARSTPKQFGHPFRGAHARPARRRSKSRSKAPARLPELDWPSDLFADNASMLELMVEDFPRQWHLSAMAPTDQGQELYIQVAA